MNILIVSMVRSFVPRVQVTLSWLNFPEKKPLDTQSKKMTAKCMSWMIIIPICIFNYNVYLVSGVHYNHLKRLIFTLKWLHARAVVFEACVLLFLSWPGKWVQTKHSEGETENSDWRKRKPLLPTRDPRGTMTCQSTEQKDAEATLGTKEDAIIV